jgi:hypothetical protein
MKTDIRPILAAAILLGSSTLPTLLTACSSQEVRDARTSGVERRQDRMDARTAARQERWRIRGEREDARAAARFNSW